MVRDLPNPSYLSTIFKCALTASASPSGPRSFESASLFTNSNAVSRCAFQAAAPCHGQFAGFEIWSVCGEPCRCVTEVRLSSDALLRTR